MTFLKKTVDGDQRLIIAQASDPSVASAPLIVLSVLELKDTQRGDDLSGEQYRWLWFYEAGTAAHNALLEGTAWGLSGTIISVSDTSALQTLLRELDTTYVPLLVVPLGTTATTPK